jgi:multidrug transporter EmrE-like cation transporter
MGKSVFLMVNVSVWNIGKEMIAIHQSLSLAVFMGTGIFGTVNVSVWKIGKEMTAIHQVSNGVGVVKQLHQS